MDDEKSIRPWTGSTHASSYEIQPELIEMKPPPTQLIESNLPPPPHRNIVDSSIAGISHPTTPWARLPDQGPHQRKTLTLSLFTHLASSGKKFHLQTKLQHVEKERKKQSKIAAARLKKHKKRLKQQNTRVNFVPIDPATPSIGQKGVSTYTQALRKGLNNYYNISVRNCTLDLWIALTLLAERTGGDEKDLIDPPPLPEPTEEDLESKETSTAETATQGSTDVPLIDSDTPPPSPPSPPSVVMDSHGIGRPLYYRFYRRLFVALRSLQDNIPEEECKTRVRDAEVMAGIIKKKEKKSKLGLSNFMRRSSSGGGGFTGGLSSLLGKIAKHGSPKKRRNSETSSPQPKSAAKKRWGMIQKEVCNTMSWSDLLKKRKDTRAARAVKAGELTKIFKHLTVKDWGEDSTFVGVEIPMKTSIPLTTIVFDGDSGGAGGGGNVQEWETSELDKEKPLIEEEASRILQKKRMSSETFRKSMVVIARHYADSGSAIDFCKVLQSLLHIVFWDIDMELGKKKFIQEKRKVALDKNLDNTIKTVVMVPPHCQIDPMAWTKRRLWDMKAIQKTGRSKMWDSSCRLSNEISKYKMCQMKQDWFDGNVKEHGQQDLKNTRIKQTNWVVGFGGTVTIGRGSSGGDRRASKYATFGSTW